MRSDYEEPLGHRLLAGADLLAHPARFEPCGLVPIYALRYGTIPIVRNSGGLADSVVDASPRNGARRPGTGFVFENSNSADLLACVHRALDCYRQPIWWHRLQVNAMKQDFSWDRAARRYADLYHSLLDIGVPLQTDVAPEGQTRVGYGATQETLPFAAGAKLT